MPSFDIESKTNLQEVDNALGNVAREIAGRFDFKGSHCSITRAENTLTLLADDEYKLGQLQELLRVHLTRRKVDSNALDMKEPEKATGNSLRQIVLVKQGAEQEISKRIVKEIKSYKLKVQASIQGDSVRVTGKKRDDLQDAIAMIRGLNIALPLQFTNFRD